MELVFAEVRRAAGHAVKLTKKSQGNAPTSKPLKSASLSASRTRLLVAVCVIHVQFACVLFDFLCLLQRRLNGGPLHNLHLTEEIIGLRSACVRASRRVSVVPQQTRTLVGVPAVDTCSGVRRCAVHRHGKRNVVKVVGWGYLLSCTDRPCHCSTIRRVKWKRTTRSFNVRRRRRRRSPAPEAMQDTAVHRAFVPLHIFSMARRGQAACDVEHSGCSEQQDGHNRRGRTREVANSVDVRP